MHRIRVILSGLLCLGLLAACAGPPAQNQRGSLRLTITGLPETAVATQALTPNATADVTVTGPGDFSQSVTESTTLTDLTPGTYTVAADAVTEGGVTYTPDPATQQVTVEAEATASASVTYSEEEDFSLSVSDSAPSVAQGSDVSLTVMLSRETGFSADVALSLEGAPAGVSGSFDPATLAGATLESTLNLSVGSSVSPDSYPLTVVGTSGGEERTVMLDLTVTAGASDYSLTLSESALSAVRGESVQLEVTLERSGGFSEDVTLSLEDAPAGVSGEFSTTLLTGSITSSTLTLEVDPGTAEGSYELSVVGTAASETRSAELALEVTSLAVSGTVVDLVGQPLGNVSVKLGSQTTTTAPDGSFTLSGTTIPYDITVYSFTGEWADTFVGLTRPDPVLQVLGDSSATAQAPRNEAEVSGTLADGSGFPLPANTRTIIGFGSSGTLAFGNTGLAETEGPAYPTSPPYTVAWTGANTVEGSLHALQIAEDATTGFPTGYPGYGNRDVTFTDGGTFANQDIDLGSGPSTLSLSGNVQNLPMGFDLSIGSFITLDGDTTFSLFSSEPGAPQNFSFLTPNLPDSTHTVVASAFNAASEQVLAWATGRAPNASGVTLVLPDAPPQPISPADASTGVTTDTEFSFSSPITGAITIVQFRPGTTGPQFNVITTGTEVQIPDLSAEGLGLPPGETYSWTATSLAPFTDMDEGAGIYLSDLFLLSGGISGGPERDLVAGAGSSREFTTAP